MDLEKLKAPFPPDQVHWRVGSTMRDKSKGMALAYIDARNVMERLDEACGPENWQCRYPHADSKTCCEIGINLDGWVWKADGAGDTDVEGSKGAFSDSFKRAAVKWGIGRYLYDLDSPWVELEPRGKSFAIKKTEMAALKRMLGDTAPADSQPHSGWSDNAIPAPAKPDDKDGWKAFGASFNRNMKAALGDAGVDLARFNKWVDAHEPALTELGNASATGRDFLDEQIQLMQGNLSQKAA